jgi:hypothetical protein
MGIVNNVLAGASGQSGYNLSRSLRLRKSASAYLNRTPTATGSRRTFTLSFWTKLGSFATGVDSFFWCSGNAASSASITLGWKTFDGTYTFFATFDGANGFTTSATYRDPASWYHIVLAIDTTQATAANRAKLYVNGTQITSFSAAAYPAQNTDFEINTSSYPVYLGALNVSGSPQRYFDGYMTEINFIDGQQLTPSSFGSTNTITGVWQPKKYAGTYGTNGFYLPFTDNSAATATTIGKDFSGNGNNWTPNNISVTAGATYDSMTDVPTLTSTTTCNYAVLNPVVPSGGTYSNANLRFTGPGSWGVARSSITLPTTGKYYFEGTVIVSGANNSLGSTYSYIGLAAESTLPTDGGGYTSANYVILNDTGWLNNNGSTSNANGAALSAGNVIGVAVDTGANTFTFYRNNTSIATGTIGMTAGTPLVFVTASYSALYGNFYMNFGQQPFVYTAPTGFLPLNTYNI